MILKNSVSVKNLQPQIVIAIIVCNDVYREHGYVLCITSVSDSIHMKKSKHELGQAIDIRTRMIPKEGINLIAKEIRNDLTPEFDVVVEIDHIHIEYDPN